MTSSKSMDTELLETRIMAEALSSGRMFELSPEDFRIEHFQYFWAIMQDISRTHGSVDYVLLGETLARSGVDHRNYLQQLATENRLSRPEIIPSYANMLRELNEGQQLKRTLTDLAALREDPATVRAKALEALKTMTGAIKLTAEGLPKIFPRMVDEIERRYHSNSLPGITTGFPRLDDLTGGWQSSDLNLIAARPSVGKTALMVRMALAAGKSDKKVALVSAEQPAEQIAQRMIAIQGQIPAYKLRNPKLLDDAEWDQFSETIAQLVEFQIQVLDKAAPPVEQLPEAIEATGCEVVFVDYVQRLKAKGDGIFDRVSFTAQALKEMARDLHIPVIALSQINRAGDGKASMLYLKGAGDLEQEADSVMILTRAEDAGTAKLVVDKNRHGPIFTVDLLWRKEIIRFDELEKR